VSFGSPIGQPGPGQRTLAAALRQRRRVRLTVIWLAVAFGVYLFLAWMLGPVDPATATRNFFVVLPEVLRQVFPFLLYAVFIISMFMIQFVGLFWLLSRGVTYTILPGEFSTGFRDVRGMPHVVNATNEVMVLFQGFKQYRRVGAYPPHGILFEGPPGTGKTLLAKAIAGESGVPFMYASGAGFANMFLGIPQMRVRMMFRKARLLSDKWGSSTLSVGDLMVA
jgi:ATP-dependent Zn protease